MIAALTPVHSRSERLNIERAVVSALDGLRREAGGYLVELGQYTGEFGAGDVDVVKNRLLGRSPAILVSTGDAEIDIKSTTRRRAVSVLDLHVDIVSTHLRSREARLAGDESGAGGAGDPGAYVMLVDVRDRVMGADLGVLGAGAPILVTEEPLLLDDELSVVRATYRVRCAVEAAPPAYQPVVPVDVVHHKHNSDPAGLVNPVAEGEATPMPDPKTIRVRMAPGLSMPLPSGIAIDTIVEVMTPETEVDVLLDSRFVRRRLAAGDFVEVPSRRPRRPSAAAPKAEE